MLYPFTDFEVPNLKEDATDKKDFTLDELGILRSKIAARQPHIESPAHLMLEAGLRVNECCGLKVSDLVLDADIPYVQIQGNPFRPLKTKGSKRFIPLVGVALVVMKTAIGGKDDVEWVFPTYIDEVEQATKNKDIRDELGGWASSVSDKYGSPADIKVKQSYHLKSIDVPSGVGWA